MEVPTENLEEEFWKVIEKRVGIDEFFYECIETVYFNRDTREIKGYRVTNPDGEESSTYRAKENGIYAFKVEDLATGKIYTKKVEVTNVDKTLPEFIVTSEKSKREEVTIVLKDVIKNKYTTFEKAYIIYNNEKIEITDAILESETESQVVFNCTGVVRIGNVLRKKGKIESTHQLENTDQMIILVKDNVEYSATTNMGSFEE